MNRKDFFKKLGAGVIVAAVAPKVLVKETKEASAISYKEAQRKADLDLQMRMLEEQSYHLGLYTEETTTTL